MLVHICCSVDSHYFIQELAKAYPDEKIIGFFYDPNIHPYSEHELRFLDVKRSCDKLGIKLYKGEYEYEKWLNSVRGYENEPEKGARCQICFDFRMQKSVEFAKKIGEKKLTTTLLTSPKKDLEQLKNALQKECDKFDIEFLAPDFRKNGGTQRQFALAKESMLYHQNYCGCIYALSKQKGQKAFIDELMSPINKQILPASIEEKITFYKRVKNLEKKEVKFKIQREKFLNYRLLSALIKQDKKPIKAYILFYSHFKNAYTKFSINEENLSHYESVKDEINLWSFEYFNTLCKNKYKNFEDFLQNPLKIEQEIKIRQKHFGAYDLSPVIIVENIIKGAYEFMAKSEIYFDSKEKIVKL
ncbi:epoxyqueuosine reductase QueH [Campylobacter lari]|uniref:epoxyqueuosine reductase QueH n=1 Tax=Campylobacter lari TaxID=201 RepID=UPI00107DEC37|nr:epoxyqueuosine reductase QueH [Campylobacter lari]EAC1840442.1 diacylglucosamine hydrolase like protein [Campylobacter lari]EAH4935967.1 diacylglucosamine hydrolase like protein [Campylobacter lari]EAH5177497.1 diacylglucosamine hydrolase like protein [Campylobacter lari]EAH7780844.1 diacylglucosamine hydrolase like protein [Campylobacter lari]EAH8420372.1 diacylglucosamine hydrolase like protein [Campylobacter lari]